MNDILCIEHEQIDSSEIRMSFTSIHFVRIRQNMKKHRQDICSLEYKTERQRKSMIRIY
jgi:hypothetical protein